MAEVKRSGRGCDRTILVFSTGLRCSLHLLDAGALCRWGSPIAFRVTNGLLIGLRSKWYADGTKLSEATIVDGKLHGPFRRWHPNGELAEDVPLKDGHPDGLAKATSPAAR